MTVSAEEVHSMAALAKLAIAESDVAEYADQLSRILDLVEQMKRCDTTDVEPMSHPLDLRAHLRPDEITETDQRERFQTLAPHVDRGLYTVPKVIE
jgi:aspartyl-tRNA(Asn)/glutamyl-tRNA(Gln) amidotransferase subunit C